MSTIKESFNNILDSTNNTINKLMDSEQNYIVITFVIVFFILFSLISWIYSKLIIQDKACNSLNNLYSETNPYITTTFMQNINDGGITKKIDGKEIYDLDKQTDPSKNALPRNFYVKTAYNCCCIEGYKNNFVHDCALKACIRQGARCLDFEIYSLNNKPIIAASTANNNFIKETYNYINFDDILHVIKLQAFDEQYTKCHLDPLYLHFRIMSENKTIFDTMGNSIKRILYDSNPDNSEHFINIVVSSVNYNGTYYLETNIKKFNRKIIIICYCKNNNYIRESVLGNYTNILSNNSEYFSLLRFETIEATGKNQNSLIASQTKNKFFMVLPNLNNKLDNFDFTIPLFQGCHFIAMKFQNFDSKLAGYFNYFKNQGGFSFIQKPNNLLLPQGTNTEYNGGVYIGVMPNTIRNKPPGLYTISGNLIGQSPNDNYKALMCGNPNSNSNSINMGSYQPLAVNYAKILPNGSIENMVLPLNNIDTEEKRLTNLKTCGQIFDLSIEFKQGNHINDVNGNIIKK